MHVIFCRLYNYHYWEANAHMKKCHFNSKCVFPFITGFSWLKTCPMKMWRNVIAARWVSFDPNCYCVCDWSPTTYINFYPNVYSAVNAALPVKTPLSLRGDCLFCDSLTWRHFSHFYIAVLKYCIFQTDLSHDNWMQKASTKMTKPDCNLMHILFIYLSFGDHNIWWHANKNDKNEHAAIMNVWKMT